ncbi:GNAT family N-acetyltransferase [Paenarthrobacter sp. PH39-S1]|uniref:GNAT family N-acetyltransferase n=1 Tax=Paenarthrobacter sp. PH39-S1 TaxID=3046204 RepID=UPI0032D95AB7
MAKMLSRVVPWLASRNGGSPAGAVRALVHQDTDALGRLVGLDPVANVFMASQLETAGSAVPAGLGTVVLGYFEDDGALTGACWIGANVVPVQATAVQARFFGQWLASSQRNIASIFGPAEAVLGIYAELECAGAKAAEIRADQPLLVMAAEPGLAGEPGLVPSREEDFAAILPAAAAMFEEEVGYSPFLGGEEHYRRRIAALIRQGYSLSHLNGNGEVIFKADLGAVSSAATQIQGVWLNPEYRGRGLSAGYMAAVVRLAQCHAPLATLYVNDYNVRARATYERVGFRQVGTFATVLF